VIAPLGVAGERPAKHRVGVGGRADGFGGQVAFLAGSC
jgi:hypothetical protein